MEIFLWQLFHHSARYSPVTVTVQIECYSMLDRSTLHVFVPRDHWHGTHSAVKWEQRLYMCYRLQHHPGPDSGGH